MKIREKVAIVTGGAQGIGEHVCRAILERGGKVRFQWNRLQIYSNWTLGSHEKIIASGIRPREKTYPSFPSNMKILPAFQITACSTRLSSHHPSQSFMCCLCTCQLKPPPPPTPGTYGALMGVTEGFGTFLCPRGWGICCFFVASVLPVGWGISNLNQKEDMIRCDGQNCKFKWYHFSCAGITRENMPEGEWPCGACSRVWRLVGALFGNWFVPGVGEFFHFTWGLERKQGPCIWGIIISFFYSKANALYFPGVGVSIDRCIRFFVTIFQVLERIPWE